MHIMSLLDRLESAKKVLEQTEDIEETINKLNNLEYFLIYRFLQRAVLFLLSGKRAEV